MKKLKLIAVLLTGMMMTNEAWGTSSNQESKVVKNNLDVYFKLPWDSSLHTIKMSLSSNVKDFKKKIAKEIKFAKIKPFDRSMNLKAANQILCFNEIKLPDNYTLDELKNNNGSNPIFVYPNNLPNKDFHQSTVTVNIPQADKDISSFEFTFFFNNYFVEEMAAKFIHEINKRVKGKELLFLYCFKNSDEKTKVYRGEMGRYSGWGNFRSITAVCKKIEGFKFYIEKYKKSAITTFYCKTCEEAPSYEYKVIYGNKGKKTFEETLSYFQNQSPSLAPEEIKQLVTDSILFDKAIVYDSSINQFKGSFNNPWRGSLLYLFIGVAGIASVYYFFLKKKTLSVP